MLRLAADENLPLAVVRGLLRLLPEIDVVRVQDAALRGADDPTILAWAASEERLVVTHDVQTMTRYAYERVAEGAPMPGLIVIPPGVSIGTVVQDLADLVALSEAEEWVGPVVYLPL